MNNKIETFNDKNSPLNYKLNEIILENQTLKKELKKLELSNMSISVEKEELKKIINLLKNKERESQYLQEIITEKENEIENFRTIILNDRRNYEEDLRKAEKNFENALRHVKRDQDTVKHKIDNFNKMNHLNDILYSKVLELEQNIEDLKKEEEIKLNNKEIEYTNKMDKYKKRLIDFLKRGERQKEEEDQKSLNNKLNILHIQELIGEIEFQNQEVNNLLKEKKELKIKIMKLTNDLNIYKIMVLTLAQKNDEYQKKLKYLKKPIKNKLNKLTRSYKSDKNFPVTENNNNEDIKNKIFDKRFQLLSPSYRVKRIVSDYNIDSNIKKGKNKIINNYTINNNESSKKKKLDSIDSSNRTGNSNKFINEKKEKEKYKDLYEFYKSKYDCIINKFKNIFNMYTEALEKIYKEENKKNNSEISININDFKDFKFEKMTFEQKYSILIKLINHLAPLVWKKDFEENSFIDSIFKVKQKYNIFNMKKNSIFSKTQKNFEEANKLKSKTEKLINSSDGCTISTYFSPSSKKNGNNFNRLYSSTLKFSKIKEYNILLNNIKIPQLIESKTNGFNKSPFKFY